jgi:methylated-DNA-[protein]-cysteine S-methyltransferase
MNTKTMNTKTTAETLFRTIDSPVGTLTIAGDGTVVTNLRMTDQTHDPAGRGAWRHEPSAFVDAVEQLHGYFDGERTGFDLALRMDGSTFQRSVWDALLGIPYGETTSYGEIARRVGKPGAARAVGLANGQNPIAIIVPCHRVIGADGSLTGYGGGLDRKVTLLQLERDHYTPRLALQG